ncbi:MAG: hypothetical protein HYT27_03185 [Parcubacteria group bacterium]|nr:hypothetical protein [Parcubacteria group bacterium]
MPTSNDYVIGKYLETTVSCSHGLKYDAEKIYCKGSNSRSDGKITDVQISWKLIKEIHHNGVTLLPQECTKSR